MNTILSSSVNFYAKQRQAMSASWCMVTGNHNDRTPEIKIGVQGDIVA
jgi:hypothetical protein